MQVLYVTTVGITALQRSASRKLAAICLLIPFAPQSLCQELFLLAEPHFLLLFTFHILQSLGRDLYYLSSMQEQPSLHTSAEMKLMHIVIVKENKESLLLNLNEELHNLQSLGVVALCMTQESNLEQ